MCGLVGIAGDIFPKHNKMFRNMLILDTIRGLDSTGVAAIKTHDKKEPWVVEKELGGPTNLWDYQSSLFSANGVSIKCHKAMLGHNRAATKGAITQENAHPFEYENIVGMHNGSLTAWSDLEGWGKYDVDSKALLETIDKKGVEHTWKSFYGAAALVWWDKRDDTLNFIRNSQRPLVYTWDRNKKVLFYASEFWMIKEAAKKAGVDLIQNEKKANVIYEIAEDEHFKFHVTPSDCKLLSRKKVEPRSYVSYQNKVVGFNTGGKRDATFRWCENLKRAPKLFRRKVIHDPEVLTLYQGTSKKSEYVRFKLDHEGLDQMVQVFPASGENLDWIKKIIDDGFSDKLKFKLKSRPRVVYLNHKGEPSTLRTSFDHVELIKNDEVNNLVEEAKKAIKPKKVVGRFNIEVTQEIFESQLKEAGDTCSWCSEDLIKSKPEKLFWMKKDTCLCEDCAHYGETMGYGIYQGY